MLPSFSEAMQSSTVHIFKEWLPVTVFIRLPRISNQPIGSTFNHVINYCGINYFTGLFCSPGLPSFLRLNVLLSDFTLAETYFNCRKSVWILLLSIFQGFHGMGTISPQSSKSHQLVRKCCLHKYKELP